MYYENHKRQIVRFDGDGFRIEEYDLRDFNWEPVSAGKPSGVGGSVTRFIRGVQTKTVRIVARGKSEAECVALLNGLHAVTETDIYALTPGRFYLDGQYMICYLGVSSGLDRWEAAYHYAKKTLSVTATHPFWLTEVTKRFFAGSAEVSAFGKTYNGRHPYQYSTGYANSSLLNEHYVATPAIITMYGPCVDPAVYIGSVMYGVEASIADGERVVIDQMQRRIYKVASNGSTVNLFDARYKEYDQFAPVAAGVSTVAFSGDFAFDVTLLMQRSEPLWI